MSCLPLTSLELTCENSIGGLLRIYATNKEDILYYHTNSDGEVDAVTFTGAFATHSLVKLEFNKTTAQYNEEATTSAENSSLFFTQTVELSIARRDSTKRKALDALITGLGYKTLFILDRNNNWWIYGKDEGAILLNLTGGSSNTSDGRNGYTLTFNAEEREQAPLMTEPMFCNVRTNVSNTMTWTYGATAVSTDGDWDAMIGDDGFNNPSFDFYLVIQGEMYHINNLGDFTTLYLDEPVLAPSGTSTIIWTKCKTYTI